MAVADLAGALLGGANPAGAALGAVGAALGTTPSSNAKGGPVSATGPVINIAGFGSKASGSASSGARSDEFPAAGQSLGYSDAAGVALGGLPSWVMPAALGIVVLIVGVSILKRGR